MHISRRLCASLLCGGLLFWTAGCTSKDSASISQPASASARLTPAEPPASTPLGFPPPEVPKGKLRQYYKKKYSDQEISSVKSVVDEVLRDYGPNEKSQATAEILSFHHVVFHITPYHRLSSNHAAIRRYEATLRKLCEKHGVPVWPVLAITSWENSGGSSKISWADAGGLGQMTWGAVDQAHAYAASLGLGDLGAEHRRMAKAAKVGDERLVAECNLEDVVLFFKFLYTSYGGRADHAIGAYHKGLANHDDILRDYLTRKEGYCPSPHTQRGQFLEALARNKVTYVSLWNDTRSRQMLNGLRTMDGEVTNRSNASEALGDESDIYPWKVLGSLAAYRQGPVYVGQMMAKYSPPQPVVEVAGLPAYPDKPSVAKALKEGELVRSRAPVEDLGPTDEFAHAVTPELEGYLLSLTSRWRQRTGKSGLRLPVRSLLGNDEATARGVTVILDPSVLSNEENEALQAEIKEDYLNDRVYQRNLSGSAVLLCLNPRFGHEFIDTYEKLSKTGTQSVAGRTDVKPFRAPSPIPVAAKEPPAAEPTPVQVDPFETNVELTPAAPMTEVPSSAPPVAPTPSSAEM